MLNRTLITAASILGATGCLDGGSGPSDPDTHGWVVGAGASSDLVILHTSNGSDWEPQGDSLSVPGADLASVSVIDDNTIWAAGGASMGYGVVVRTTDGGQTWNRLGSPASIPEAILGISAVSRDAAWIVGDNNAVYRTADGGISWQDLSDPAHSSCAWQSVFATDFSSAWLSGADLPDGRILHTGDGGATWTSHAESLLVDYPMISITAWDDDNIWAVGHGFTILRTTDGGSTWVNTTPESQQGSPNDANGITLLSKDDAWVVLDYGNIWKTGDGGVTWTTQSIPPEVSGFFLLRICAIDQQTAWVSGGTAYGSTQEGVILHTTDGGSTWTRLDDGTQPVLWGIDFVNSLPN